MLYCPQLSQSATTVANPIAFIWGPNWWTFKQDKNLRILRKLKVDEIEVGQMSGPGLLLSCSVEWDMQRQWTADEPFHLCVLFVFSKWTNGSSSAQQRVIWCWVQSYLWTELKSRGWINSGSVADPGNGGLGLNPQSSPADVWLDNGRVAWPRLKDLN